MRPRYRPILVVSLTAMAATILPPILYDIGWLAFNHPARSRFPIRGIDVSHHQGAIDWQEVRRSEYRFAYIKATEGGDFTDPQFHRNWQSSADAGLVRGAYHFYTLCRPGADQAAHFIRSVPNTTPMLPPAIDLEFGGNCSQRPTREEFEQEFKDFFTSIRHHYGTEPILYTTKEFFQAYGNAAWTKHLWIRDIFFEPDDFAGWIFWQYYSRATVPGITGPTDVNVFSGKDVDLQNLLLDTNPTVR